MPATASPLSRPKEPELAQVQNHSQRRGHIVVVGCGIAGAAAANRLHRQGFEVTILEAEANVGGRTSTRHQNGFKIDLAASMLLTSYHRTMELIAEQNWWSHFEPACDVIGVERADRIHHIRASRPLGALTTGLLSPRAKARLAVVAKDVITHRKLLDWQNPVLAADLHYPDVREYADVRVRSSELRDYLIDPACRFLNLTGLQDTSAVDFLLLAKNMGKTELFNSPAGIDTLVRLLVADVKVETEAVVAAVEEHDGGVTVSWMRSGQQSRDITADACVIAVPAPFAAQLYPQMGEQRARILTSIVYSPALNVYVGVDVPPAEPSALILIPHVDYSDLACVILDHNKTTGRTPPGKGLISSYWHKDWTAVHWNDSDEDVVRAALPQIERLLPDSTRDVTTVHVQRWRHALVTGPVSRYRDLERFKSLTPPTSRVRFAGDGMSSSTINSCLCSGERAADDVITAIAA
jgi:oxygen-dependent protoporphyrinogen oxidase